MKINVTDVISKGWTVASALTILGLAGCSATGHGVQRLGPDTYTVTAEVLLGPNKAGAARAAAMQIAEAHCRGLGREVLIDGYQSRGHAMSVNGETTVNFRCLTVDDPDFKRPSLRPEPSVRIEDSRSPR